MSHKKEGKYKNKRFYFVLALIFVILIIGFSYNTTKLTGEAVSKKDLVAYWNFNSGTTTDSSGMKNHGSLRDDGAKIISYDINRRGVLLLDGVDDYMLVKDSNSLDIKNTFTLAAWINSLNEEVGTIFSKDGFNMNPTDSYNLYKDGDFLKYEIRDREELKTEKLLTDTWHHVAVTYDAFSEPNMKMYIDGELVNSGNVVSPRISNRDLLIGRRGYATDKDRGSYFKGMLDELKIYNRALNSSEIKAIAIIS